MDISSDYSVRSFREKSVADGAMINAGYMVFQPEIFDYKPIMFSMADTEDKITSVIGDIRDKEKLNKTFESAKPEMVFHLAAQPIVRESYADPVYIYETNVMGTVNILECVL